MGTQGLLLETLSTGVCGRGGGGKEKGEKRPEAEKRELGAVVCLYGSTDRDSLPLGRSYGVKSRRAFRHGDIIGGCLQTRCIPRVGWPARVGQEWGSSVPV